MKRVSNLAGGSPSGRTERSTSACAKTLPIGLIAIQDDRKATLDPGLGPRQHPPELLSRLFHVSRWLTAADCSWYVVPCIGYGAGYLTKDDQGSGSWTAG